MAKRLHSVTLDKEKCKGCTNCIKGCPTEAIRARDGIAQINSDRCIDCGECIRRCSNHAKVAVTDDLQSLRKYAYTIALPAPALYGQFDAETGLDRILEGLRRLGFDEVYEVARGADFSSFAIRKYLEETQEHRPPLISSACPAIVRLIQVRFPNLIKHLVPIKTPMDIAAENAKTRAQTELGFKSSEIGVFFITPCPAKAMFIKEPVGLERCAVDGAISMIEVYGALRKEIQGIGATPVHQRASGYGIGWARAGGENLSLGELNHLAVDGIHNVISVLEEIDLGKLTGVDYVEAAACTGGCVGGPLTVENPYVARVRIRRLAERLAYREIFCDRELPAILDTYARGEFSCLCEIFPEKGDPLDEDLCQAIVKAEQLEAIDATLPGLDCGACGAPTCRALAEDIVKGIASETDCVFKLRQEVHLLAESILDLAKKVPPAMGHKSKDYLNIRR